MSDCTSEPDANRSWDPGGRVQMNQNMRIYEVIVSSIELANDLMSDDDDESTES